MGQTFLPINLKVAPAITRRIKNAAKACYPKEFYGILLGHDAGTNIEVTDLYIPEDLDQFSTTTAVNTQLHWIAEAYEQAEENAATIIGDIHSHPFSHHDLRGIQPGCAPSELDILGGNNYIIGIVLVAENKNGKLRASIRYWGPSIGVTLQK